MARGSKVICFAVALAILGAGGCARNHTASQAEYLVWLDNPEHGLVRSRTVNGLRLTVKYLPLEYRVRQELRGFDRPFPETEAERAEAERRCANSVALLLTITRDESHGAGPVDPQGLAAQANMLNADIKEHLALRADGAEYAPVLSALDNDAGMSGSIGITAIYVDDSRTGALMHAGTYDVTFDDPLFGTGRSHFAFSREAIGSRMILDN